MSHSIKNIDLTQGNIRDHLIRLSLPMVWGILAIISFQLVDTFFISMLGTEKLAAISFTFPVTMTYFSLSLGFGIATSSVTSRMIGSGGQESVRRVVTHSLILVFSITFIMAIAGILFHDPLFRALGASEDMLPLIDDFMNVWLWSAALTGVSMTANAAMRAGGETMTQAKIMMVAALINFILDPILIFGLFGFPRLELQGAAITNVIASTGAMLAALYVLWKRGMLVDKQRPHWHEFGDSCKRLLVIAVPAGVANALPPITNGIIISLLAKAGAEAVAAFGVVTRVEAFAFIILMALAVGMSPLVGQNWGARNFERVNQTIREAILFSVIFSLGTAIIFALFARPIAQIFSADEVVVYYTSLYFLIVPITYAVGNLAAGWGSAFNAIGKPQYAFLSVLLKTLLLVVPFAYAGFHLAGVTGAYAGIAAGFVVSGIVIHMLGRHLLKKATTA